MLAFIELPSFKNVKLSYTVAEKIITTELRMSLNAGFKQDTL